MSWYRQIPNALTLARCVLTAPMAYYLIREEFTPALILFVISGISDGLDGFLAKRFNWQSRFGAIADPLADKLLLTVGFCTLAYIDVLPIWLAILVVVRDIVIVAGAYTYHRLFGPYDMRPSLLSKFNTLTQIVVLSLMLVHLSLYTFSATWIIGLIIWVSLTTVGSGVQYVWVWGMRTAKQLPEKRVERKKGKQK